jgi:signal transduction histidine kinase
VRTLTNGLVGEVPEKQGAILERLETRLDELLALVNDLLALAKSKTLTEDTPLVEISLLPIIKKTLEQFESLAAEKNISLRLDEPGVETNVHASEDGLGIIFTNLISNAIKYSNEGGAVEIKITPGDQSVQIEVKNTGIGIPQNILQKIGQEFFRAPNAQSSGITGTGLGLSIVQLYLDHFEGEFSIESQEGQGTTITVNLVTPVL